MRTAAFQPSLANGDLVPTSHRLYSAIKSCQDNYFILDACERLSSMPEYATLNDTQKAVIIAHVKNPELTKDQLAGKLGIPRVDVYATFKSNVFHAITKELADQEISELSLLAVQTLRKLLLHGSDPNKFNAAVTVLRHKKVLEQMPTVKTDNKIVVFWGSETENMERKVMSSMCLDGHKDTVQSASETS